MLALPRNASLCEWCEAPIPAYGSDTCPACQTLFDGCLEAERDFTLRLAQLAGPLIVEWVRDWAHLPASDLKGAITWPLGNMTPEGYDLSPLEAIFDVAYAAAKGGKA